MEVIITLITYSTHGTVYNPFIRILKRNPDHNLHFTHSKYSTISGGSRGEGTSPSLGVSTVTGAATSLLNLGPGGPEVQGIRVSMQAP